MSVKHPLDQLGRRERQIMDILYRNPGASAADVQAALPEAVSNSAVRGMLRYLAGKGYVKHRQEGPRYIYFPVGRADAVSRSALQHLVSTFFRSSPSSAIAALIDMHDKPLSDEEYQCLRALLDQAREPGETK
jgi:BlaI family transcriptional regulator, penicillinase repressor